MKININTADGREHKPQKCREGQLLTDKKEYVSLTYYVTNTINELLRYLTRS